MDWTKLSWEWIGLEIYKTGLEKTDQVWTKLEIEKNGLDITEQDWTKLDFARLDSSGLTTLTWTWLSESGQS